jgi:uncharacterized protein HemY
MVYSSCKQHNTTLQANPTPGLIVLCICLQEMAPREYLVHMLLGRLYRRLGAGERALAAFSAALDLGPSGSDKAAIKAAMDRLNASDDEEEEEL